MSKKKAAWGATLPSGAFLEYMPQETLYLRMTGHLMASEREEHGFLPQMMCGQCREHPLDMIYRHSIWTEDEILRGKTEVCECGKVHGKMMPGTVWGEDVTCICPCCSFDHCTHKPQRKAA